MSRTKRLREKLAEIESLGFIVKGCEPARGSHVKARLVSARGTPLTIVFAISSSCYRAEHNFSAYLRRLAHQEAHR